MNSRCKRYKSRNKLLLKDAFSRVQPKFKYVVLNFKHKSTCIKVFLVLVIFTTSVRAQDVEKKYKLGGFLELDQISYLENKDNKINSRNQGIVHLELESNASRKYKFFGGVEIRNDLSDVERDRVFVDEAYIDIYTKNIDFRLGKQIITWGEADAINPTNNLNPIDYSDLLDVDDERIGVFSAQAKYYVGDFTFEGVFIPVYQSSILPRENSRWFRDFPTTLDVNGNAIPATFNLLDIAKPPSDLRGAQYALKVAATFGGWDTSVSYYRGFDDLPSFEQTVTPTDTGLDVTVAPVIKELQVFGADFSTSLDTYGLRGEFAYYLTEDEKGDNPFIDDSFFQYVIGLDRTFSDIIGDNNLFVIMQWVHQIITSGDEASNLNLNNVFQESILTRMEYELNNFAVLTLQGTYDFKAENFYIQPEIAYDISSGLSLSVFADVLGGERDTFFGFYRDNNRFQFRLKYNF